MVCTPLRTKRQEPSTEARPGLLLEDRADEGALACLEYVRIPERDPEALQACGSSLTVVEFLARPPPLGRLVDLKVEHVPVLDLVAVWGDVVDGLAELARDAELAEAGFLARFAQGGGLGGFSMPDASRRDLDADVLQVVVSVAEDQELASRTPSVLENRDQLGARIRCQGRHGCGRRRWRRNEMEPLPRNGMM